MVVFDLLVHDLRVIVGGGSLARDGERRRFAPEHLAHRGGVARRGHKRRVGIAAEQVFAALRQGLRMRIHSHIVPDVFQADAGLGYEAVVDGQDKLVFYEQVGFVYEYVHGKGNRALKAVFYGNDALVNLAGVHAGNDAGKGRHGQTLGVGGVELRRLLRVGAGGA